MNLTHYNEPCIILPRLLSSMGLLGGNVALMECPECTRQISDKAETCPQCGYPVSAYLEKLKAEKAKAAELQREAEEAEAEILRQQKIKDEWKAQALRKQLNSPGQPTDKDPLLHQDKLNIKLYVSVGIIILLLISVFSFKAHVKEREEADRALADSKKWFISAKTLLTNGSQLPAEDLYRIKDSLQSVTASMTEYAEAQNLLKDTAKRLEVAEKELAIRAERDRKQAEKERIAAEEAQFTKAGKRIHAKHPDWDADLCNTIGKGQIHIGMTAEQVRAAWGRPYKINRSVGSYGTHEQWVMYESGNTYVYFEDGNCTSMQGVN